MTDHGITIQPRQKPPLDWQRYRDADAPLPWWRTHRDKLLFALAMGMASGAIMFLATLVGQAFGLLVRIGV